jgi:hypothetical protein
LVPFVQAFAAWKTEMSGKILTAKCQKQVEEQCVLTSSTLCNHLHCALEGRKIRIERMEEAELTQMFSQTKHAPDIVPSLCYKNPMCPP